MSDRRTALRSLAVALLLFGFAFEVGHLRHHLDHAHLHADADHAAHRECLIFHTGALVEAVVDAPPCGGTSRPAPPAAAPRSAADALRLLPESRAPPRLLLTSVGAFRRPRRGTSGARGGSRMSAGGLRP